MSQQSLQEGSFFPQIGEIPPSYILCGHQVWAIDRHRTQRAKDSAGQGEVNLLSPEDGLPSGIGEMNAKKTDLPFLNLHGRKRDVAPQRRRPIYILLEGKPLEWRIE